MEGLSNPTPTLRSSAARESSLPVISSGRVSSSPTGSFFFILAPISRVQMLRRLFQLSAWKRTVCVGVCVHVVQYFKGWSGEPLQHGMVTVKAESHSHVIAVFKGWSLP